MNTRTQAPLVKRHRAFRQALIGEGMTARKFAQRLRITEQHLGRAFRDPDAVSTRIHAAIDQLIAKHQKRAA